MARGAAARQLAALARQAAADGSRSISSKSSAGAPSLLGKLGAASAESTAASSRSPIAAVASRALAPAASRGLAAQAALAVDQQVQQVQLIPEITTDLYGAVSPVLAEDGDLQPGVFKNQDGHRFDDGRYKAFQAEISAFIGEERQFTDPVRTLAYGTDASFYRLNPKLVVKVHNEAEIKRILPIAAKHGVPVTFRAAGTSLSGQAITDSVLLKLSHTGKNFRNYEIHVRVFRGVVGRCLVVVCVVRALRVLWCAQLAAARRRQRAMTAGGDGRTPHAVTHTLNKTKSKHKPQKQQPKKQNRATAAR